MTGYPFYYGNEDDIDQDQKFMVFFLKSVSQSSVLTGPLVVVETAGLGLGDEFTYRFCDQISKVCGGFHSIPETQTLVLDYDGFCRLVSQSDVIIQTLSCDLEITKQSAIEQAQLFFSDKNVIVQAEGIQGVVYKVGSYMQSAGSAGLVANTIALAQLAGVTGLQILKAQPLLVVAIPTTGAMFFYGCGAIVGNNTVGKALITTGDILALPMKGVEIMWNSYGNMAVQKVFGMPVILNMTQTFKTGPGYTLKEISKYASINKESVFKVIKRKIKEKIAKW
jgi:hypothetical protein